MVRLPARYPENPGIEPQQFFGREKLVIISKLREITDALASNRLTNVDPEEEGGPAGGIYKAKQNIHGGRLAGPVGSEETKDFPRLNFEIEIFQREFPGLPRILRSVLNSQVFGLNNRFHVTR